jgi:hypothetical protein
MTRWRDDPILARRFHPEHPDAFTRFCPFCRGVQVVYLRSLGDER